MDDGTIHLTPKGAEKLRNRLKHLKLALPERIAETARTAAYGDRSDNAEYKDAKSKLRRTHYQILETEEKLKRVEIVPDGGPSVTVRLGSTVTIESKDGSRRTFRILGPHETDPSNNLISYRSPLGAALMGRAKGERVEVATPRGPEEYRVLEIS